MSSLYQKDQPSSIRQMFSTIAERYDRGNQVLSFGLHNSWNHRLVKIVCQQVSPSVLLDLCSGTGDIALAMAKSSETIKEAFLLDFCPEMLSFARDKTDNAGLSTRFRFITADATDIPIPERSIDAITIAYGVRNIDNRKKCFEESFRTLRPGGVLGILELTKPKQALLAKGHSFYLKTVMPFLGKLVAKNRDAYEYLCQSVHNFVDPELIEQELLQAGFLHPKIHRLHGGIATVITARKDGDNSQEWDHRAPLPSLPNEW